MTITTKEVRITLFAGAIVFALIALVIATLVIPRVLADIFPRATPQRAAAALGVSAGLNLLIGTAVLFIARRLSDNRRGRPGFLGTLGGIAIVLDLILLDAAGAFRAHGPELATATMLLYICSVIGSLAGILLFICAVLLRKRKSHVTVPQ